MLAKASRRLVIDTSIARSSGGEDATYPTSKNCRDFLQAVLKICHQFVLSPDISNEWNRHQSSFARRWRTSMFARKKVCYMEPPSDAELCDKIERSIAKGQDHEAIVEIVIKDIHLVEAALATDRTVIALDDRVRFHFNEAAGSVGELRNIVWLNPDKEDEQPIPWLEDEAKPDRNRLLGYKP